MIEIEDIRQEESFDCGATCAYCVCRFFQIYKPKKTLERLVGTTEINGTSPAAIEAFFKINGFKTLSGNLSIEDLKHFTKMGRPIIVLITLDGFGHYVIIKGVYRGHIYFHCPISGNRKMKTVDFQNIFVDWDRNGTIYRNFGLVVWI